MIEFLKEIKQGIDAYSEIAKKQRKIDRESRRKESLIRYPKIRNWLLTQLPLSGKGKTKKELMGYLWSNKKYRKEVSYNLSKLHEQGFASCSYGKWHKTKKSLKLTLPSYIDYPT